jgi:CelD/BcsL family acetyltransferase involved in cellulose biosynthesis
VNANVMMRTNDEHAPPGDQQVVSVAGALEMLPRMCASVVGIVAVVAGLWLAVDLFSTIYGALRAPEAVRPLLEHWAETLGGDKLTIKVADQRYPLGTLAAAIVVGVGCCVLAWLALGVMLGGAKIIALTSSDREAIRRILQHAFGPAERKP